MWLQEYDVQVARDRNEVAAFLHALGLGYDFDSDISVIIRRGNELVATGSLRGDVLQCIAVKQEHQGKGLSARIVDWLVRTGFDRGLTKLFVFTGSDNTEVFRDLGFRQLVVTRLAAFLELGTPTIDDYVKVLSTYAVNACGPIGGIVMNSNPFTLGHRYLVERASQYSNHVFVLVVEEDRSAFPLSVRLELVKRGIAHLNNVTVLPSGPYVVSLATFPSYFSAEETTHALAGASIDATLYGKHIAKALGVTQRFVGTEPFSPVTAIYNSTMDRIFAEYGLDLVEIPRLEVRGRAVSASLVREALRTDNYQLMDMLVPESTREFLLSSEAMEIIAELKARSGRH